MICTVGCYGRKGCFRYDECGKPYDITSVPPYAAGISHRMQVRYRIENISPVPAGTGIIKRTLFCQQTKEGSFMVEIGGLEPLACYMRSNRSTN